MNGYHLFSSLCHLTTGSYSNFWNFLDHFRSKFVSLPYEIEIVLKETKTIIDDLEAKFETDKLDGYIENILLCQELKVMLNRWQSLDPKIQSPEDSLKASYKTIVSEFATIGLEINQPHYEVVDNFPKPYDKMQWAAFAPDKSDEEKFGINPGVYFRRSDLVYYYSDALLAHELIHTVTGRREPNLLGRGLEEGLAEILGGIYCAAQVLGYDLAVNIHLHNYQNFDQAQLEYLYVEYSKQASAIYREFGIDGLVYLANSGRRNIKIAETACYQGKVKELKLPRGNWDMEFGRLLQILFETRVPNLVVSPLAYYVASRSVVGETVDSISESLALPANYVRNALDELQHKIFALVVSEDAVDFSDVKLLIENRVLRYEVGPQNE